VRDLHRPEHATTLPSSKILPAQYNGNRACELEFIVFQQPPRADVISTRRKRKAGPQDDPTSLILRDTAKIPIVADRPDNSRAWARACSKTDRRSSGSSHRLAILQTMPPVFHGHARGVNFTAANLEGAGREQGKIISCDGEGMPRP